MDINIRNEESKDIEQVRAILESTFPTGAESKLVDALRANGKAIISFLFLPPHRAKQYEVDDVFMVIHFSNCDMVHGLVKYVSEFALFSL